MMTAQLGFAGTGCHPQCQHMVGLERLKRNTIEFSDLRGTRRVGAACA